MAIIPDLGVTIGTGKTAMDRAFIFLLGHKKGDLLSPSILFGERVFLVTAETGSVIPPPDNA
jgi:hypothetical protein